MVNDKQARTTVWVVDDHQPSAAAVAEIVRGLGYVPRTFGTAELAYVALEQAPASERCSVLLTDLRLPGMDGLALLQRFRIKAPGVGVVVITAHGSIDHAVEAMRAGAFDFLTKPLDVERVETVIRNTVVRASLDAELLRVRAENKLLRDAAQPALVFRSPAMRGVLDQVQRAASSDATVLVLGESGTGKERIARLIHESSERAAGPYVATHLAALAEGLLESELFGHERGAFTGALGRHTGRFEDAEGGTLFLDEIAEIDGRTQVKLLRVLQERLIVRVGGASEVKVNTRLVAATHRNLDQEVAAGRFRTDLLYRLDVVRIVVPPLRERNDDIAVLLAHFLDRFASKYGRAVPELPADVGQALLAYRWPGNVRELENVAERLVVMGGPRIRLEDVPLRIALGPTEPPSLLPAGDLNLTAFLENLERELLRRALERAPGNKAQAARSLGLSREALRYKLQKYGFDT
ncbi:MAG: Transcriptional regulatory protein ZraR [Pseudomonadota bacterium]